METAMTAFLIWMIIGGVIENIFVGLALAHNPNIIPPAPKAKVALVIGVFLLMILWPLRLLILMTK